MCKSSLDVAAIRHHNMHVGTLHESSQVTQHTFLCQLHDVRVQRQDRQSLKVAPVLENSDLLSLAAPLAPGQSTLQKLLHQLHAHCGREKTMVKVAPKYLVDAPIIWQGSCNYTQASEWDWRMVGTWEQSLGTSSGVGSLFGYE